MPRPTTEMAESSGLDGDTLRQKLEEWKKEKRKQKEHEQKKPFVTTVLKPVPAKPQSVTQNKPPPPRKAAYGPSKAISKPTVSMPAKRHGKPVAAMVKSQPKPQESLGGQKREEKENKKPCGQLLRPRPSIASKPPILPKHGKAPEVRCKISKPSAPQMETPLCGKTTGIGKRHAIACFAKAIEQGEEMVRPRSLADELQAATSSTEGSSAQSQPVGEPSITDGNAADSPSFTESVDDEVILNYNNTSLSQIKGASRDSLTKRFRKSKQQSLPVKNSALTAPRRSLCAPNVLAMKKVSRSAHSSRSSISNPCKSILKQKSITADPSSALGASPELPVSKPHQSLNKTQDRTTSLKKKIVEDKDQAQIKAAEVPSSGHVCFVTPPTKVAEGAHYRKTPGKVKTEELMRSKLNEWLAAKGRTPITFRHTACFHGDGEVSQPAVPRSQIKASMSVEQLSRQENALAKEDLLSIRQRLEWTGKKRPSISCHSLPVLPPRTNTSTAQAAHSSTRKSIAGNKTETKPTARKRSHQSVGSRRSVCFETTDDAVRKEGLSPSKKRLTSSPAVEGSGSGATARVGGVPQSLEVCSGSAEELNAEFQKCLVALESGMLGAVEVLEWLNIVGEASAEARHQASWYKCRVATLKQLGNEDAILAAFEQAIIHSAQPAEELAELLTTTMKELLSEPTAQRGRRKLRSRSTAEPSPSGRRSRSCGQVVQIPEVGEENMFESTVVKFSVKEVTPFKKRRRTSDLEEKMVSVVTPVRRSTRRSSSMVPGSSGRGRLLPGTPQVVEYSALEEVPSAEKQQMLYVHNWALESVTDVSLEVARQAESPRTSLTSEEDKATEAITE